MSARHFPLAELQRRLIRDGVQCHVRPGAQGRSARMFASVGYYRGCQAICHHHTGSSGLNPLNDITYIESGKGDGYVISNAYTSLAGVVTLIASGPTYTEGRGGPLGIIPANRGNDVAFSNEIASPGQVDSIYPGAQQIAVEAFGYHAAKIAAEVWVWPDDPFGSTRTIAHFEWAPGRKVDPRGISIWSPHGGMWDMAAYRADLRNYEPFAEEDDDMARINGFFIRPRGAQDQFLLIPQTRDSKDRLEPDEPSPLVGVFDLDEFERRAGYPLTPMPGE